MFLSFIEKYLGNLSCFHLRKLKTSFVLLVVGEKVLSSNCIVISSVNGSCNDGSIFILSICSIEFTLF